jgi:hypothetical protein
MVSESGLFAALALELDGHAAQAGGQPAVGDDDGAGDE